MAILSRWLAPAVLVAGFGLAALAPAHAQSDPLTRVLVDVADVVLRGDQPYYRYGNYDDNDRLVVRHDRYGRPMYYRLVPVRTRSGPPYGNAWGYYDQQPAARRVTCNRYGNCTVSYYNPQYDRRYDARYPRYYDTRYPRHVRRDHGRDHDRDRHGGRWHRDHD